MIQCSEKGIDHDPDKAKIIQDMEPPTAYKQLQSFMGRVLDMRDLILALTELLEPFHKPLKKNVSF